MSDKLQIPEDLRNLVNPPMAEILETMIRQPEYKDMDLETRSEILAMAATLRLATTVKEQWNKAVREKLGMTAYQKIATQALILDSKADRQLKELNPPSHEDVDPPPQPSSSSRTRRAEQRAAVTRKKPKSSSASEDPVEEEAKALKPNWKGDADDIAFVTEFRKPELDKDVVRGAVQETATKLAAIFGETDPETTTARIMAVPNPYSRVLEAVDSIRSGYEPNRQELRFQK